MMNTRLWAAVVLAGVGLAPALSQAQARAPETPAAPSGAAATGDETLRAKLAAVVEAWFAKAGPPGATVAVVLGDGRAAAVAVGLARKDPAAPMKPTDRMMSGSIGKTFVSAVMLRLVEDGKADLDGKVSTWLGDREWFARLPNAPDLTLRMLMQHTSGIREHVTSPEFTAALRAEPAKTWRPEEIVAFAAGQEPLFPAGQGWSYADTNYILVGMVIEKITGRRYEEELRERILAARGLGNTYAVTGPDLPGLISGYTTPDHPFPVPAEVCVEGRFAVNPQFEWTGGGMVTTSSDLARWARMLYGGDVLKEQTRRRMLEGVAAKTGPRDRYGLGVQIWPTRHGEAVGHSGYFPGYVAVMAWYPEKRIAGAAQINTDVGAGKMGLRRLLDEAVAAVGE